MSKRFDITGLRITLNKKLPLLKLKEIKHVDPFGNEIVEEIEVGEALYLKLKLDYDMNDGG